jgi:L-galactose dehydrogenase
VLGKALKTLTVPREQLVISTKCGRYGSGFDFSAKCVTASVDESLKRLNLEYVDFIQCHDIEFGDLDQVINETLPALVKLKETGKVRFIGITGLPLKIYHYV